MSTENPLAERLLTDARKKTARQTSTSRGTVAVIVGIVAVLVGPAIPVLGWIIGLAALGTGGASVRHPATAKQAKIAMVLGVAAIMVSTFFFTLGIARL